MPIELSQFSEAPYPDILLPDDQESRHGIATDFISYAKGECQNASDLYKEEIAMQKARLLSGKYTFEQEEQISDRIANSVANQEKANYRREKLFCITFVSGIGVVCAFTLLLKSTS